MKTLKGFIFVLFIAISLAGVSAGQKAKPKKKPVKTKPVSTPVVVKKNMPSAPKNVQFEMFLEGSMSLGENKPFIYVARNKESYAVLKEKLELTPLKEIDFSKFALVGAFMGMKPTGGYSVNIGGYTVADDMYTGTKVKISAISPAPGQIVVEAFTSPFKVVLVPVEEEKTLVLEIGPEWKNSAEIYKITSGNFHFSGGFAFTERKFFIEGSVLVWRAGDLISCAFELSGKGDEKARKLLETASGKLEKDGSITLFQFDPGGFVNNPRPALKAKGRIDAAKLSLEFTSLPTHWSDGFEGQGKLEAVKQK